MPPDRRYRMPPASSQSLTANGAVVTASWDESGHMHVDVEIDGIPDSSLIDGSVPLDISVNGEQVFPPPDDSAEETWNDEL